MWRSVGYYNGAIGPLEEMTVPMQDRALYFGDGIYEATCVANRIAPCMWATALTRPPAWPAACP